MSNHVLILSYRGFDEFWSRGKDEWTSPEGEVRTILEVVIVSRFCPI